MDHSKSYYLNYELFFKRQMLSFLYQAGLAENTLRRGGVGWGKELGEQMFYC